jgi:hypothetical protein
MFFLKVVFALIGVSILELVFAEGAWAWGPAAHTVIACKMLEQTAQIMPFLANVLRTFPLEYLYGSLSADFFVGKSLKSKNGHSHAWDTGFRFLQKAEDEQEVAYAWGFLSHLAADIVAHNYFVPNLIQMLPTGKRMGHLYWEAKADYIVGPTYMRIAKEVLTMEHLGCDDLLKLAVGKKRNGLKARRHIFTHSVKINDFLYSQPLRFSNKRLRYRLSQVYLSAMIGLSARLVKDILQNPETSACFSFDPIGSRNLRLASRHVVLSRLFNIPRPNHQFTVDQELLEI